MLTVKVPLKSLGLFKLTKTKKAHKVFLHIVSEV